MYGWEINNLTYHIDLIKLFTEGLEPGEAHELVVGRVVDEDGLGRTSLCIAGHYAEEEEEPREDSVRERR